MRPRLLVILLIALSFPLTAAAEPLPGLLDAQAIEAGRQKAAQQKRDAQAMVRGHAAALGYGTAQVDRALDPAMVRQGTFRISLKDGTQVEFPWFRIGFAENRLANTSKQVDRTRQETNKGGVRLHYGVFADEVYALALKMDTKLAIARDAIAGHAVRGAKGGIGAGRVVKVGSHYKAKVGDYVDPAAAVFNRAEIIRSFGKAYRASGGDVGPGLDIQAGDVNTKAPEMKVLAQTYGSLRKLSAGVSGKAVKYRKDGSIDPRGGIEYRAISTGEGTWMAARLAAHHEGVKVRGATVACQGWGEVGRAFGLAAVNNGARIVAVQELWNVGGQKVVGTLLNPYGAKAKPRQVKAFVADIDALKRSGEDIQTFQGGRLAKFFRKDLDVASIKADIVGNNAMGNVLNEKSVPMSVKAGTHQGRRRIHVEGANLAETAGGAKLIEKFRSKLLVVPGDLANLGGVHVSNLEAVQNLYAEGVSSRKAKLSLLGTVKAAWNNVVALTKSQGITERTAVERVAVDGMMKRSLQLKGAPRASLELRVISKQRRSQGLLAGLGSALQASGSTTRVPLRVKSTVKTRQRTTRVHRTTLRTRTLRPLGSRTPRRRAPSHRRYR